MEDGGPGAPAPTAIGGFCDAAYAEVEECFRRNLEDGLDLGASVAVIVDGELLVDLYGGRLGTEPGAAPWERTTLVNVFSTMKTVTALLFLMLERRGMIELDRPLCHYWPEFAAAGKREVTIKQILGHSSGLAGWDEPVANGDLYDWDRLTALLASQAPWWEPGTASGYHSYTQGYLLGELTRKVTGVPLAQLFREEIARPMGIDVHFTLDPDDDWRLAPVLPPPDVPLRPEPGTISYRTFMNPVPSAEQTWDEAWRRSEIPAAAGYADARSLALLHDSFVADAGSLFEVQARGRDLVMQMGVSFGLGVAVNSPRRPIGPNARTYYWGGWGGSLVAVDLEARVSFAFAMNRMRGGTVGDERSYRLLAAVYRSLGTRAGI